MPDEPLKIVSFQASNIKKLTAIEITPDGNMVVLKGENGAGKSSVLDSIWYVLTGKRALPERPIRDGASRAEATVKLGNPPNVVLTARLVLTATPAERLKPRPRPCWTVW
jgi:recombinational DNA repair ATPase RecF